MRVVLLGPPGVGKGTQGRLLAQRTGNRHIAAGDLLRAEVRAGTELGIRISTLLEAGDLVPDDLVLSVLLPAVLDAAAAGGYILDGFPRTLPQARTAAQVAAEHGVVADAVISLQASRPELVSRLLARAEAEGRADDRPDVIEHRLRLFDAAASPLLDFYRARGILLEIDSRPLTGETAEAIDAALRGLLGSAAFLADPRPGERT
jgi:adenylate kinase